MDLTCICWNVRNLVGQKFRNGVIAHGIPLETRLSQIVSYVKIWKPDLMLIIEAGPDVDAVCMKLNFSLNGLNGWSATHTANNKDGEAFVLISRNMLPGKLQVNKFELYGKEFTGHRRSARLLVSACKRKICFLVMHPPSPKVYEDNLEERLGLIHFHAQEALHDNEHNGHSILLCGDLNIRRKEYEQLADTLIDLGYDHRGPIKSGEPVPTSLRRFKTILRTEGDTESQPFDQIWNQPLAKGVSIPRCEIIEPQITVPVSMKEFPLWLAGALDRQVYAEWSPFPGGGNTGVETRKKETRPAKEGLDRYLLYRRLILSFPKRQEILGLLEYYRADVVYKRAVELINFVDGELVGQMNINPNLGLQRQLQIRECGYLKVNTGKANHWLSTAFGLLELVTSGSKWLCKLEATAFEYAISDHLPIAFVLRLES